ncbi:MAG: hypothetical protein KDC00_04250 [Flavobacteriales bacterium]|nr:hypothetical protein [Flavobacteriales bacterium]
MIIRCGALLILMCASVHHTLGQQGTHGPTGNAEQLLPDNGPGLGIPNDRPSATLAIPGSVPRTVPAEGVSRTGPIPVARKAGSDEVPPPPPDIPVRTNTGDPDADEARHLAAKQAWMREHPDRYVEYMRALRARTPRPHD